jgi:6-pyruvoyltetrahydropterin/6-carboxytetrahydropterin synthase
MFEISKQFRFEAAHTLNRVVDAEGSRRIHGHSYRAEVVLRGEADPCSGMLVDLGLLERCLSGIRDGLDHRFLDEINDLGPATMENLAVWIWQRVAPDYPGLVRVNIFRDGIGESCSYFGPTASA